ncbi:hypothetical protein M9978_08185 [Sphingomonas sp. MG17]|uniref:Uncharacterized protein n=1 Tax=Sphingomonas tagetis TaxID=2949092 RepID=A0A9X2KL48_9SPHN|nr:hypothetical protein [Sphingomonas tagetis]MCP3730405.1 hypothetical protein [Sphingomonas tagetis]
MTDILAAWRAVAEAYNGPGGKGFKNTGKTNAYVCERTSNGKPGGCGAYVITIDRAPGVTPFIVRCRSCGGEAYSKAYRVASHLTPTYEWYRPDTLDDIGPGSHDHLSRGGLILRPIPGMADQWPLA